MSKPPSGHKTGAAKDMYWFAHGGIEENTDKSLPQQVNITDIDDESTNDSLTYKPLSGNKGYTEELKPAVVPKDLNTPHLSLNLGHNAMGSLDREDRPRTGNSLNRKYAVEDRRKQIWDAEQERNEALMKKHLEREAAFEARRNAQRSHISLAFGSTVPRNLEPAQSAQAGDFEKISRFPPATSGLSQKSDENYEPYLLRSICSPLSSGDLPCLSGNNTTATLVDGTRPLSPLFTQSLGSCGASCERKALSPPCWLVGSGAVIGE